MVSSTSNQFHPIKQDGPPQTAASPVKTNLFGLPVNAVVVSKINDVSTNIKTPTTQSNNEVKETKFTGKQILNGDSKHEAKVTDIFAKKDIKQSDFLKQSSANNSPRSGEIIISKNKELLTDSSVKNISEKTVSLANSDSKANLISFSILKSEIQKGDFKIAYLDEKNKLIDIRTPTKNTNLTDKNTIIITATGTPVMTQAQRNAHPDIANYQLSTKDKSLEKELQTIKENLKNGSVVIVTEDQIRTLNQINQQRLQDQKNPNAETSPKDNQKLPDNKTQATSNEQKINEDKKPSEQVSKEATISLQKSFLTDEIKNEKAAEKKRNEELLTKKKDEEVKASMSNEEKIDERVLNRLKGKN